MENENSSKELLQKFKDNKTYENVSKYIIAYINNYKGEQGYYDYYNYNESKYSVFKLRYRGIFYKFKFVESPEKNTFVYDVLARAVIDIPYGMVNQEKTKQTVYAEIQERAPKDILEELKRKLCREIDDFISSAELNIVTNIKWRLQIKEVDLD